MSDFYEALRIGEMTLGWEGGYWFEEYRSIAAEEGGELRAYARAYFRGRMLEMESGDVHKTQLAAIEFLGKTGVVAEELAWRLYDEESGELIDEASTINGRFVQIDSNYFQSLDDFKHWLFPALEALAAKRERREIAKASEEGKSVGSARRRL